jgi:hypothetical protein
MVTDASFVRMLDEQNAIYRYVWQKSIETGSDIELLVTDVPPTFTGKEHCLFVKVTGKSQTITGAGGSIRIPTVEYVDSVDFLN